MPPDSQQQLQPEKDLFLRCFEEHFEMLSPLAKGFYFLNFKSHIELVPWILQKEDISQLHCDPKIKREVAFFISKLRYHLEKAGYDLESLCNETKEQSKNKGFLARFSLWPFGRKNKTPKTDKDEIILSALESSLSDLERMQEKLETDLKELREKNEKWKQESEEHKKLLEQQTKCEEEIQNSIEQSSKLIDDIITETKEEKRKPNSKQETKTKRKENRKEKKAEKKGEKKGKKNNKTKEKGKGKEKEKEKKNKKCEGKTKPKQQKKEKEKGKRLQVHKPSSQERNEYEWNRRKDGYLIDQYHQLICLFPYETRKHIINIIPTMEDMLDKTTAYTRFSDRIACKKDLDTFVSMFRFIYDEYPYREYDLKHLYKKVTGRQPHHDMTIYEKVMLHILENTKKPKDRWRFLESQHLPLPQENDGSYNSCRDSQQLDPATSVFCIQKEQVSLQLDELFSPDTAYPDFIILAVTLVQAAREVTTKLSSLKLHFNRYDLFAVVSLSKTTIHLYSTNAETFLVEELFLTREKDKIYVSLDENNAEKRVLNVRTRFFDDLYEKEHEFQIWLKRLRTVLQKLSNDRLVAFSDFYTIKVFDKSNSQTCSLYTLIRWIESHDIWDVASQYHVTESKKTVNPKIFPGKFRY